MHIIVSSLKFIFIDILADFVYWPVWWYTVGLRDRLKASWGQVKKTWFALGLTIWLKNMFKPMYGDRSIMGRMISFPMRLVVLVWRLIWFLLWLILILLILLIWILGPIAVGWMIGQHFKLN